MEHFLPLELMGNPHPLELLRIQPQQSPTCDCVVREGLHVDEIVVRTVFLQPLAHVLLGPKHHGLGEAAEGWAGVVDAVVIAPSSLWHLGPWLLQEFDGPAACCPLTSAIVPGEAAPSVSSKAAV